MGLNVGDCTSSPSTASGSPWCGPGLVPVEVEDQDAFTRADAKTWLGRWTQAFAKVGKVTKTSGDTTSNSASCSTPAGASAQAATGAVCTIEPVLDEHGNQLTEQKEVTEYGDSYTVTRTVPMTARCALEPAGRLEGGNL